MDNDIIDAIKSGDLQKVKSIIDNASENNINLDINRKDNDNRYELLYAIDKINIEIVNIIIDYAKKKRYCIDY